MRILALLFAVVVGWPGAAFAAGPNASPVPLLWKASAGERSVYLLGSFHLLKPSDYPLSADVDAAFDDAESLLFEMPPEEMGSIALAMEMGQAALRTDGTTLDSELPPATATRPPLRQRPQRRWRRPQPAIIGCGRGSRSTD